MEIALSEKASIIMIQEQFIGNQEIFYSGFNFYWLQGEKKNIRIITGMKKNLVDKIVIDYRTDLINHLYFMLLKF